MSLRTCLLISDDPDDHLEFSEALYEISSDTVILSVSHPKKALDLLASRSYLPNYIFLDLGIDGIDTSLFLIALEEDPTLQDIPLIAYGEYNALEKIHSRRITSFLSQDFTYTDLRTFLSKIVNP